ncbi:MAG: hypothetical protein AAF675_08000 [Pseudomonadota bacterium]
MDLGVATHFSQGWDIGLAAEITALGADHARDSVRWEVGETGDGLYRFEGPRRDFPETLAAEDIDTRLVFLARHPAYEGGATVQSPAAIEAFGDYILAALAQFPDVATVEIGNEFNASNFVWGPLKAAGYEARAEAHAEIVAGVRQRLDRAGAEVTLLGGAAHSIPVDYLAAAAEAGLLDTVDAVALHPYTSPPEHLGEHLDLLRARLGAPSLRIHATEFGREGGTPTEAADHLVKMSAALAAAGVESATWYALAEQKWFPNMELLGADGATRPAGRAFALMQHEVLSAGQAWDLALDPLTQAIAFGDGALVIWGSPRGVKLPGARWLDARGEPVAAPVLHPARPLIALADGSPLDLTDLTLEPSPVLADSFFEFALEEGRWQHSTLVDGKPRALEPLGGGKPGAPWRPYLGLDWLRPLQVTEWTVVPANFSPGSREKAHPITETISIEETGGPIRVCGFVDVPERSADGITLSIAGTAGSILDRALAPGERLQLDLPLAEAQRLAFTVDPGDTASGDRIRRRYVIVEGTTCPPVRDRL